ncbi:MAG: sugar transferase [Paracoccaceae bacterium]|nr:sugar transferase [Paracoccaceae bacterium]
MTIGYPRFNPALPVAATRLDDVTRFVPELGLVVQPTRKGLYRSVFKRALDLTAIVIAAPIIVPIVAALAFAVSRDGGKAFYTQQRVGKDGRAFRMWKLRSMVSDADAKLEQHLQENSAARQEWDETQKLQQDPRITPLGRLLRRSSLDELPQLWNVFRGDMSLVGPRPMILSQRGLYPGTAYFALRPGITGYWQTVGRSRTTFAARAEYDAAYEAELSFWSDARMLAKTVKVVINCTGC